MNKKILTNVVVSVSAIGMGVAGFFIGRADQRVRMHDEMYRIKKNVSQCKERILSNISMLRNDLECELHFRKENKKLEMDLYRKCADTDIDAIEYWAKDL